ncbi:DNA-binding response OmpR family regulator [Clostridium beijerinckii]|nr:DNA-binding response OmpR family regulator [Clostridium beijerinckii]
MVKILIVEDDEKLARFVELELLHEGYEILKADNGRLGLEIAEKGEVDLVLLDIMIPQINGLEVLRRIRKTSDLPVIMLTARDAVMDKVSGLDAGADDYITKPFAIEELLARIRTAIKRRTVIKKKRYRHNKLRIIVFR